VVQRKHLVAFIKEMIEQLEKEPIPLEFECEGIPVPDTFEEDVCYQHDVELNGEALGIIRCVKSGWKMDKVEPKLVEAIGEEILAYYD
jgi:hypothetical protein